jgi:regulatory protein
MELAAHFLATRPRTRREVERRLQRAGAAADVVEATLARLAALSLLDDLAFARWWTEQRDRHAPRGRRMVEAELRQHGVPHDVIERMRDEEVDRSPDTEEELARIALERHLRGRPLQLDRKAMQRVGMFLVRRGFGPEIVRATLRRAGAIEPDGGASGE